MDPVALVIGAGDATGGAIARRFAREGYVACVARRNADKLQPLVAADRRPPAAGPSASASDARKEEQVVALVDTIEREIGPIEVLVFNIGANVPAASSTRPRASTSRSGRWPASAASSTAARWPSAWCARGRGTILFTGATAALRGSANFAAFAGAKHALRALAQSMARELGPQGHPRRPRRRRRRDRHRVHPHATSPNATR